MNVNGSINGSGSGSTNLNYNNIYNPPAIVNLNDPTTFISSFNVSGNTALQGSLTVTGATSLRGATTCVSSLNVSGITTFQGNTTFLSTLIVNSNPPNIQLNTTNNYNIGVAVSNGNFSSSAITNDLIIRSGGNLLLQNGQGAFGLKINTNNNVLVNKILSIDCLPADNRPTVEAAIFASIPTFTSVFGGDSIWTSYWGFAVTLNAAGTANGNGGYNNTQSHVPGWSAFTVNTRTSTTATSFD